MRTYSAVTPDKTEFSQLVVDVAPPLDNWKNIPRREPTRFSTNAQQRSSTRMRVEVSGTTFDTASYPVELGRDSWFGEWTILDPHPPCRGSGDEMQRREVLRAALREAKRISEASGNGSNS